MHASEKRQTGDGPYAEGDQQVISPARPYKTGIK